MSRQIQRPRSTAGAALITALILTLIIASLIGASLLYSQNHHKLAYVNARSEAALLLAEAGVNDELQYVSTHLESPVITQQSSQPVVGVGETEVFPPDGTVVKGRKGTVDGQPDKYFWVYSSQDQASTTGWDGRTPTLWITATAKFDGSWKRVQVQAQVISIFTLHAIFALASYDNNSNAIAMSAADVNVVGTGGTNGKISNSSSTLIVSNAINANTNEYASGQFTLANVASGGQLFSRATPVVYPSVSTVLRMMKNRVGDTDAQVWSWFANSANNSNNTGIYTYRGHPGSNAISPGNCQAINLGISALKSSAWTNAGYRPGSYLSSAGLSIQNVSTVGGLIKVTTAAKHGLTNGQSVTISGVLGYAAANGTWKITTSGTSAFTLDDSVGMGLYLSGGTAYPNLVKTLIFEPGDYYFSSINLDYSYQTQFVIDPQAYASGGTAGQVRFWVPLNGSDDNKNDSFALPVIATLASGASTPDPALFRLYYSKDGKSFTFTRPGSVTQINEASHTLQSVSGNFNVYGGVYAVTKLPGESNSLQGTEIDFEGTTGGEGGTIELIGSLLADKLHFQGPCWVVFQNAPNPNDPHAGAGVVGGYTDGG